MKNVPSISVRFSVMIAASLALFCSNADAYPLYVCYPTYKAGQITALYLNDPDLYADDPGFPLGVVSIEVSYPHGPVDPSTGKRPVVRYNTKNMGTIGSIDVRNLLDLANAAYSSAIGVYVVRDDSAPCSPISGGGAQSWVGLELTTELADY